MYIVIEVEDLTCPYIIGSPETGMPIVFDNEDDAYKEAENCHRPIIVNIKASWKTKPQ